MRILKIAGGTVIIPYIYLLRNILGSGNEAKVYRYNNEALKLYVKKCRKRRLNNEDAQSLSELSTDRILLPSKMVYNADSSFGGYTLPLVEKSSSSIFDMAMGKFASELDLIHSDIGMLSSNSVRIGDLHLGNILYDGNLYFCDPGSYVFDRDSSKEEIYRDNMITLSDFLKNDFFDSATRTLDEHRVIMEKLGKFLDVRDFIGQTCKKEESVKEYVRRMAR